MLEVIWLFFALNIKLNLLRFDFYRNIPAENIVLATSELSQEYEHEGLLLDSTEPFNVHIDGVEFTGQPLELAQTGQWQTDKDLIIGHSYDEYQNSDVNIGYINKDTYLVWRISAVIL